MPTLIMHGPDPDAEIDLPENYRTQERIWRVQRIGWVVMALFVLAGVVGLLGPGFFSEASIGADGGLRLDYERFPLYRDSGELKLQVPARPGGGEVEVWIDRHYLERMPVEWVLPSPLYTSADGDRILFRFRVGPDAPVILVYSIQPEKVGLSRGRMGVVGGEELEFRQWVFP